MKAAGSGVPQGRLAAQRRGLEYQTDGSTPKLFYCGVGVERSYLACLLDAGRLRELGIEQVRHHAPVRYYRALLNGQIEEAKLCLENRKQQVEIVYFAVEDIVDVAPTEGTLMLDDSLSLANDFLALEDQPISEREPDADENVALSEAEDLGIVAAESEPSSAARGPELDTKARPPARPKVVTPGAETFHFGPFRFTPKHSPHGLQWEAACPYHKLNSKTGCKKLASASRWGSAENALHVLKGWCAAALKFERQRDHMTKVDLKNPPPLESLNATIESMVAPSVVVGDDELDAEDTASARRQARRASAGSSSKAGAKPKAKASVRPAVSSESPTDSSSSSS